MVQGQTQGGTNDQQQHLIAADIGVEKQRANQQQCQGEQRRPEAAFRHGGNRKTHDSIRVAILQAAIVPAQAARQCRIPSPSSLSEPLLCS
ncbi:hypothetical protein D3C79_923700 [compost metagenome]